jgi:hypothetical protein
MNQHCKCISYAHETHKRLLNLKDTSYEGYDKKILEIIEEIHNKFNGVESSFIILSIYEKIFENWNLRTEFSNLLEALVVG